MSDEKVPGESFRMNVKAVVEKYRGDPKPGDLPYEVVEVDGNTLLYGGASALWHFMVTSAPTLTIFNNANAKLGVGSSSTAVVLTQTDLQGASKTRVAMEATFPTHTDGTTSTAASVQFKMSANTATANHAWEEWGLFNAAAAGRMFNRKVESFGTKTGADTWTLTVTFTAS